ncbi:hypothetical protein LTR84_001594 [Exophiala bonariae]|uniref:Uncharacterized protein n=1 Tax=Exophiala bonariae TaxID=1690606 RepID=A0AAV9NDZ2_9EURO|nr:hypothetical protein LTR84_001594 [Exophiala bonariae]
MYKQLIRLILSTGLSSNQGPVDDDFFNEPSTMRVRLTAANAKEEPPVADASVTATAGTTTYQTIARGMPGAKVHYAAASA